VTTLASPSVAPATLSSAGALRVLVLAASPLDRHRIEQALVARCADVLPLHAVDVGEAIELLDTLHPHLVLAELKAPGHALGGLRIALDAAAIGLPAIVIGRLSSARLARRLNELGISLARSGDAPGLLGPLDAVLHRRPGLARASAQVRREQRFAASADEP
jgi:hypothetical protein